MLLQNIEHGIHLVVEDFRLARRGGRNEMLIKNVKYVTTDVFQFLLYLRDHHIQHTSKQINQSINQSTQCPSTCANTLATTES